MFSIRSTTSNRELAFSDNNGYSFVIELKGFNISASAEVLALDAIGLEQFFDTVGKVERPWLGELAWASMEEDFTLSVSCTPLGNVVFRIEINQLPGAAEEWRVNVGIATELGQLAEIGKSAIKFLTEDSHWTTD